MLNKPVVRNVNLENVRSTNGPRVMWPSARDVDRQFPDAVN
jgi:hypothetical protein